MNRLKDEHHKQIRCNEQRHQEKLDEATSGARGLIERFHSTEYQRYDNSHQFEVRVVFEPRLFAGAQRDEMRFIAFDVARRIEHEIATCRFLDWRHDRRQSERTNFQMK